MRLVIAALTAVLLAAVLTAQAPPPSRQQQPTFKAGVSFVRVDVYPTANGQVVRDLRQDEFEILEDNVPQRIETFELVVARAAGVGAARGEPTDPAESNEMAGDPRNRLFVVFFDTLHTAGYQIQRFRPAGYDPKTVGAALARFLDQLIGPDDVVGLMRPDMPVDALIFTRRPATFADFLLSGGEWQKRFLEGYLDETERKYQICYPESENDFAWKMIARRRELLAMDGMRSLVAHLQNLREGRKAVIVVSEGWTLFRPDSALARPSRGQMPGPPSIGISGGQPTLGDPHDRVMRSECERDRMMLARIDDERDFRVLLDDANRANVTFYPVDPRGLSAPATESEMSALRAQNAVLNNLASATDGIALINTNNFERGLRRIQDDLSSYYLLGYNSTNSKLDGKFRAIAVRVKRAGVAVRARRGYVAPTEAEAAARARAEAPRDPEVERRDNALSSLGTERPDRPFRLAAGCAFDGVAAGESAVAPALWITGELDAVAARSMEWSGGGDATIAVTASDGRAVANERASITTAGPRFVVHVANARLSPGDYLVKVRLQGKSGGAADAGAQLRVRVPDGAGGAVRLGNAMLFRRGPYSGAGFQPTADTRFRKAERIRVDVPVAVAIESPAAQLLDRRGQPLPLPVTVGQREDGGRRFATAEVTLAPLAPADYLIEVSIRHGDKTEKALTAFRIVP